VRAEPRAGLLVGALLVLAACVPDLPSPTPSISPSQSATSALPAPGRPFDADDILVAMRESRRPGGVPDELETDPIATALAEQIFTFDGEPWPAIVIGGSCGPETCTLEVAGTPDGALGEDLYSFSVTPSTGEAELVSADLRGFPEAMLGDLDLMVRRSLDDPGSVVELLSVSWLPPPDDGRFVLAYRSGGEEGSCVLNVTLDAISEEVVSQEATDC
jgi:hypothetical protein